MRAPVWLRPAFHLAMATPLLLLTGSWVLLLTGGEQLGSNPVEETIHSLGTSALRSLLLALAITPLFRLTGWQPVMTLRRAAGLWAFAYAALHLSVYFGLDLALSVPALLNDIAKRPFILFGMAAWLMLLPLAVTSTRGWIKRLGARNWQRLHRLVYVAPVAVIVHIMLFAKGTPLWPWYYAATLALLLGLRLVPLQQLRRRMNA
jgi:methionine sulfoxide reductase heme-binding subunit